MNPKVDEVVRWLESHMNVRMPEPMYGRAAALLRLYVAGFEAADHVITGQSGVLRAYRLGTRTPEKALDELDEWGPKWHAARTATDAAVEKMGGGE